MMLPKDPLTEKAWTPKMMKTNRQMIIMIRIMKLPISISLVMPNFSMVSRMLCR